MNYNSVSREWMRYVSAFKKRLLHVFFRGTGGDECENEIPKGNLLE